MRLLPENTWRASAILLSSAIVLSIGSLLIIGGCATSPPDRYPSEPLSTQASIDSFQIAPGFRVEVFATEPQVYDPVDVAFDAYGRAYAVELRDFPYETDSTEGRSRIRLLEDTDGDGRVDTSAVFAEGLTEATSVLPWKGGVLVTAAPNILYLKDTDGDRRADQREVLFSGFYTDNIEAQITNLQFGLDNWIYASNAGNDGTIRFARRPGAKPISIRGGDFRFRLDQGRFEKAAGTGRFGQAFDDWGHRFVTQATIHVQQVVLPASYPSRKPSASSLEDEANISAHGRRMFQLTPPPYWRAVRTERRNERYRERGVERTEHAAGYFTGATGGTIYTGHTFPPAYRGNLFTADISGSLVHRDLLQPKGVTFAARRAPAEQDREFLASPDPWFRPANFDVGPDGHLYMVDMYRLHVESPISIPDDLVEEMDYTRGSKHGRIYRVVPTERSSTATERSSTAASSAVASTARPSSDRAAPLGEATTQGLVQTLAHPNKWQRLTAQRLLIERQDASAIPELEDVVSRSDSPQARLHALYALEGLSALEPSLVAAVLDDPHAGVREHAVRLAERFTELAGLLTTMVEDPSPRVALQVALSLGAFSGERVVEALGEVAARHGHDPWFQRALSSSEVGASVMAEPAKQPVARGESTGP